MFQINIVAGDNPIIKIKLPHSQPLVGSPKKPLYAKRNIQTNRDESTICRNVSRNKPI